MIEKNSTGYPTLAVIQHFGLTGDAERHAWDLGHEIFKAQRDNTGTHWAALDPLSSVLGETKAAAVARQLYGNHVAAAQEFGYAAA